MKAFILAAGYGTRLKPVTDNLPKCLVPVAGKPMLAIWLEACERAGITDVLVNLHAHADQVRLFLDQRHNKTRVIVFEEPNLLGSAGTLRANRDWLNGDPYFWVFYSDVLTRLSLPDMLRFHQAHGSLATLAVHYVENPTRCGIVNIDQGGKITAFQEKPQHPTSNLAFAGVMIASPEICDLIPPDCPSPDIGFHLLPLLINKMYAYPVNGFLLDIGTPETYERAQREWPNVV